MAEPMYDLTTGTWTETCPCIRAEQIDPECQWHGRAEFRADPSCIHCDRPIAFDGEAWRHFGGTLYCPGGEPFEETATPEYRTGQLMVTTLFRPLTDPERAELVALLDPEVKPEPTSLEEGE